MEEKNKKVFVALSGGVDSAVAALLLKQEGYDVTGVFIKIWQPEFLECTWKEDRLDAMRVAVALKIPFKEIDLSDEYRKQVIEEMLSGYREGITPNPDVLCNRYIKFGALWQWAKKEGADMIATGHHARVRKDADGTYSLLRGADSEKDQSYFLCQLTQNDLEHTFFPVGEMRKSDVRSLAERHSIPVAGKSDSQGLCFVGHVHIQDFLKEFIEAKPGTVLSPEGVEIGRHNGAALYTIGQRHGFGIFKKDTKRHPHYIVDVNVDSNTLVASEDKTDLLKKGALVRKMNWIQAPAKNSLACQLRYRQSPQECTTKEEGGITKIQFDKPQVVVPGQLLVVYDGKICLGGGVIAS